LGEGLRAKLRHGMEMECWQGYAVYFNVIIVQCHRSGDNWINYLSATNPSHPLMEVYEMHTV